ncbi:MAG: hypothetical protein A3F46_09240 [Legionellales bacterium RIFCSPHIGHO2_12_FULL_42_9]|nr:MAG: hypothetical protein A3F46_09240 [Legionellales bacterium RIFCSPHIGHO2_12_FULL_42_9]
MEEICVKVPDIGGASNVDVIEILVKINDIIKIGDPMITLESDKASMEIPAPVAGTITRIDVKVGDKVSAGSDILMLAGSIEEQITLQEAPIIEPIASTIAAGPAVRKQARELGVDLATIIGSGRKHRVTKYDLQEHLQQSKFGLTEIKPLSKIKRITSINLQQSWRAIPQVTQFDEADITELEIFRKSQVGIKITILAFMVKIIAQLLIKFPQFNASLDHSGENLIYKQYYNIGVAVDTKNGLVVPVIKHAHQLSVIEIAAQMGVLSEKARAKGLFPDDMSGGTFTISSLGGIGGIGFTPLVNFPEVAILGISRSVIKPVYIQEAFKPRLILPLSLSYDHRVIDGAEAARFTRAIVEYLEDIRRILL